jgi:hypothetical protein
MQKNNFDDVLELLEGKDVIVIGCSPVVNDIFFDGEYDEPVSKTALKMNPERNKILDHSITISEEDHIRYEQMYRDYGFKNDNIVTIGLNLFPCFFPSDIALWGDQGADVCVPLVSKSKYIMTINKTIARLEQDSQNSWLLDKITHVFRWEGEKVDPNTNFADYKKGHFDTEFNGYLYYWRTIAIAAIHLACMAKAKSINTLAIDLDPMIANHFYETVLCTTTKNWVNAEIVTGRNKFSGQKISDESILDKFQKQFQGTKFYKTNTGSYLPFKYRPLKELLANDNIPADL